MHEKGVNKVENAGLGVILGEANIRKVHYFLSPPLFISFDSPN